MEEKLSAIVETIQERFDAEMSEFRGDVTLHLAPEQIFNACTTLREEFGFELLSELTAVDYWPEQEPRFNLIYGLRSLSHHLIIFLRVAVNGKEPSVPSITPVYYNANWFERELWDMFGIRFDGHPDLRRILMPYDWEGHPLRKDYPLGYEEVQFSFNFEEIDVRKPYVRE